MLARKAFQFRLRPTKAQARSLQTQLDECRAQCGHLEPKKLAERQHPCARCGYTAHRDLNAVKNILTLGLDGLGVIPRNLRL